MTGSRVIVESGRHIQQHSVADAGTDRDMACLIRRSVGLVLGTVLAAACGGGADSNPVGGAGVAPPFSGVEPVITPEVTPAAPPSDTEPGDEATTTPEGPPVLTPPEPPAEAEVVEEPAVDPNVCRAPAGVSGAPRNLPEVVSLLNSLPRPTTLACFLEALERPLQVYLTESDQSLQPSPGPRSPRTFIVNQPLVMSIVFEGSARGTLEIGYRTADTRSIKTELLFPLRKEVTFTNLFDEVKDGQVTRCSACHTSETQIFNADIQADAFESDIYPPFEVYEVDVESLRTENASCDVAAEPERCGLLSALFDHGDVVTAPQGILFSL
jgi:hypothetical protein